MAAHREPRGRHPPRWPEPTHGKGRIPYRTAAECIDWTITVPSIFDRSKPLAEATQRRIAAGLVRFVLQGKPLILNLTHGGRVEDIDEPFRTITGAHRGEKALVAPWISKFYGTSTGQRIEDPLSTVTGQGGHHSLCAADAGQEAPERLVAWIERYYSSGGHSSDLQLPLPTITTVDRMSLVVARLRELRIVDIGMRMLQPRELARAQGFPDSYLLPGTKTQQVHRIGNSVVPQVAAAVVRANLSDAMELAA